VGNKSRWQRDPQRSRPERIRGNNGRHPRKMTRNSRDWECPHPELVRVEDKKDEHRRAAMARTGRLKERNDSNPFLCLADVKARPPRKADGKTRRRRRSSRKRKAAMSEDPPINGNQDKAAGSGKKSAKRAARSAGRAARRKAAAIRKRAGQETKPDRAKLTSTADESAGRLIAAQKKDGVGKAAIMASEIVRPGAGTRTELSDEPSLEVPGSTSNEAISQATRATVETRNAAAGTEAAAVDTETRPLQTTAPEDGAVRRPGDTPQVKPTDRAVL
jgi:hypothetical protein